MSKKDRFIEWIAASSSFGRSETGDVPITIKNHTKQDCNKVCGKEGDIAYARTSQGECKVFSLLQKDLPWKNETIPVSYLESNEYNESSANKKVESLLSMFVEETGILDMDIHIWKKVFESSGKANIACFIEETIDNKQEYFR